MTLCFLRNQKHSTWRVPQGSILGPILFLIGTISFPEVIGPEVTVSFVHDNDVALTDSAESFHTNASHKCQLFEK